MKFRFEECLERGKIARIPVDPGLVEKEYREAGADLLAAGHSLADHQEKWAIIQGYYSIFHSLRALVYARGFREKSHRCLKYAVEALLVDEGVLPHEVLDQFSFAMELREGADSGCIYNEESAHLVVLAAQSVFELARPK